MKFHVALDSPEMRRVYGIAAEMNLPPFIRNIRLPVVPMPAIHESIVTEFGDRHQHAGRKSNIHISEACRMHFPSLFRAIDRFEN